jgi:rhodanese-related sulfurtransferase
MNEISVEELKGLRDSGAPHTLLDVREADELAVASIAGALWIPMGDIPARLNEIPTDRELVVMCHHGGRSARVVEYLAAQGWTRVANLTGGIDAWSRRIDPKVATYK